jgi:hypothetical protein
MTPTPGQTALRALAAMVQELVNVLDAELSIGQQAREMLAKMEADNEVDETRPRRGGACGDDDSPHRDLSDFGMCHTSDCDNGAG